MRVFFGGGVDFVLRFLTGADPLGDLALKRMLVQSALDAPLPITFRSHHLAVGLVHFEKPRCLGVVFGTGYGNISGRHSHRRRPLKNHRG